MKNAMFKIQNIGLIAILFIAFGADSVRANPIFPSQSPVVHVTASSTLAQSNQPKKPKKEKKAKAKKGGGVSFYEGSGETRAERDKRLTRECKGRPNSGLCEGYTR